MQNNKCFSFSLSTTVRRLEREYKSLYISSIINYIENNIDNDMLSFSFLIPACLSGLEIEFGKSND